MTKQPHVCHVMKINSLPAYWQLCLFTGITFIGVQDEFRSGGGGGMKSLLSLGAFRGKSLGGLQTYNI